MTTAIITARPAVIIIIIITAVVNQFGNKAKKRARRELGHHSETMVELCK